MIEELETLRQVYAVDPQKLEEGKLFLLQNGKKINLMLMPPKEFDVLLCQYFDFPDPQHYPDPEDCPDRENWPLYQRAEFLDQLIKTVDIYEDIAR